MTTAGHPGTSDWLFWTGVPAAWILGGFLCSLGENGRPREKNYVPGKLPRRFSTFPGTIPSPLAWKCQTDSQWSSCVCPCVLSERLPHLAFLVTVLLPVIVGVGPHSDVVIIVLAQLFTTRLGSLQLCGPSQQFKKDHFLENKNN